MIIIVSPAEKLKGELTVPGDKSVTHRAVILGALGAGVTEVRGYLDAEDCRSTIECMRAMGARITFRGKVLLIQGRAMKLKEPVLPLDCGNSGTTARLLMGVLAGQPFKAELTGDASLSRRPMKRVTAPLKKMGAYFPGDKETLPLEVQGGELEAISYKSPQASAQVKSAILLAGLYADGETIVEEPYLSRNHTELMLEQFGAKVKAEGPRVSVQGGNMLKGRQVRVPGDISAAAFFMVAAAVVPGSDVVLKSVGVNPTRSGIIELLQEMGAELKLVNRRYWGREPVADISVRGGDTLRGIEIGAAIIPRVIDEIPVLAVAAAVAQGETRISGAGELRVKESDRLTAISEQLDRMGAMIKETDDGLVIGGGGGLKGAMLDSCGDHRIAMALAVAGLVAEGETAVKNAGVIKISYPAFMQSLRSLVE